MASLSLNAAVVAALAPSGLVPRGWLGPEPETPPLLATGRPAAGICLVGHAGGGFWPVFAEWWRAHPASDQPLDDWSKSVIGPVAGALGGEAVFPSDIPWHPFQQWAMAAEGLKPSPLGLLIHPGFGLWHGYRGAILFGEQALAGKGMPDPVAVHGPGTAALHPCDTCTDKPCLSACPVEAFAAGGFAVAQCRSHLDSRAGQDGCMRSGCLARDACPVGRAYRYGADQIRFHMAAFV
ncbi:ferredoxin [Hoeflea ulvae]|uniref:Ferredoxin n=1 Tax=Hoeflea ulvae TaxID=2983764 RepID=A0ABT3YJB2_9HYPH|nr:ferredoxin [Hoeflea ulvae]MCY0095913.1 ferredoxin [Hoeflea ulvae]